MENINAKNFGLSGGIIWGVVLFVVTLIALWTGYATNFLNLMSQIYPGYSISVTGSFVGLLYGFVDAFIGLYIFAWIYNYLQKR